MTIRVGINGFGRIGRNFFRAAKKRGVDIDFVAVNDLGSLEEMAHLLKYDSVLGVLPNSIKAHKDGISVDGDVLKVLSERDPKNLPWGDLGVDRGDRIDRPLQQARCSRCTPRGRGTAGDRVRAVRRCRRHVRVRRQPQGLRLQEPQGDLQCELHHQLLRADGQGARRRLRRRAGSDADDARLHRRSEPGRRAAPGLPPCSRRGDQHHPDVDRCGPSDQPRVDGDEGQARRHVVARAGADRLDRRLHGQSQQARHGRRDQRGVQEGREQRTAEGHPALLRRADRVERHRHRSAQQHLRLRPDDEHGQRWSRCWRGTTTSGATPTASSTPRSTPAARCRRRRNEPHPHARRSRRCQWQASARPHRLQRADGPRCHHRRLPHPRRAADDRVAHQSRAPMSSVPHISVVPRVSRTRSTRWMPSGRASPSSRPASS